MDKDRIKKLPLWAQNEFKRLENENKYYKKKMLELSGKKDTDTFMIDSNKKIPLPKGSIIKFYDDYNYFDVYIREGVLYIYANIDMMIHPRAANSCLIKINKGD